MRCRDSISLFCIRRIAVAGCECWTGNRWCRVVNTGDLTGTKESIREVGFCQFEAKVLAVVTLIRNGYGSGVVCECEVGATTSVVRRITDTIADDLIGNRRSGSNGSDSNIF